MMALFNSIDPFDCQPDPPALLPAVATLIAGAFILAAFVGLAAALIRSVFNA
jgi:hypothetical protein